MNILEFEVLLWTRDGVRVVIRAPTWAVVQPVNQVNGADEDMSVTRGMAAFALLGSVVYCSFQGLCRRLRGQCGIPPAASPTSSTLNPTCLAAAVPVTAVGSGDVHGLVCDDRVRPYGDGHLHSRVIAAATANVQVGTPLRAGDYDHEHIGIPRCATSRWWWPVVLERSGLFVVTNGTATGCTVRSASILRDGRWYVHRHGQQGRGCAYAAGTSSRLPSRSTSSPKAVRVVRSVTTGQESTITITGYNSGRPGRQRRGPL